MRKTLNRHHSRAVAVSVMQPLLDPERAGELFGYTGRRMRQLAADGTIPFVRLPDSRGIRFRPETLKRIVEQCETDPKTAA